jgi:solute carrier family 13 (sodium-dependent dicarboxylate transporter), member 2/3/5
MNIRNVFIFCCLFLVAGVFFASVISDFSTSGIAIVILLTCLLLWIFEVLPVAVTGLLVPVLAISNDILSLDEAFSVFGSPVIALLICVLILTRVMVVSGLAERIAVYLVCSPFVGTTLRSLCFSLGFFCWLLAWWMSNTAACALFLPIVLGLLPRIKEIIDDEQVYHTVKYRLLITCAFTPSLGGMVTPVGSLPNLVSIEALRQAGIPISFGTWMSYGMPVSFVFLLCLMVILEVIFHIPKVSLLPIKQELERQETLLPSFRYQEKVVAFSFMLTVLLWLFPSFVEIFSLNSLLFYKQKISVAVAAIIGVTVLFFLLSFQGEKKITWGQASGFDWGIIILFAGGLCLGKTILAAEVPEALFGLDRLEQGAGVKLAMFVIPVTIWLSEFCSNTVAASILVPFVLSVNAQDIALPIITAFSAGFGFMLPISTPPNAIVFGTGEIPLKKMIITGFIFDLVGGVVLFVYYLLLS